MTIEEVLRRQAGVISRAQALGEGMGSAAISRRTTRGLWARIYPRVYFATDRAFTSEARVRAVLLWAGPTATLSGVAAAWWHRLWADQPGAVEITIPHQQRLPPARGVRLRRSDLDPADRVQVDDLWVTAASLTVLEAAVALGATGSQLLDRALRQRVTNAELYSAHYHNLGRRGSAKSAELLRAASDRTASEAERLLVALLRDAGLTGWRCGYQVDKYELDLAFPSERIAVEVDGWAWHSDVERFRRDRRRQNALVLAGWKVLRFTWHDLTARPEAVITEIRVALGRPAA